MGKSSPSFQADQGIFDSFLVKLSHVKVHIRVVVSDIPLSASIWDRSKPKRRWIIMWPLKLERKGKSKVFQAFKMWRRAISDWKRQKLCKLPQISSRQILWVNSGLLYQKLPSHWWNVIYIQIKPAPFCHSNVTLSHALHYGSTAETGADPHLPASL